MLRVDLARLEREGPFRVEQPVAADVFSDGAEDWGLLQDPVVDLTVLLAGSDEVIVRGAVHGTFSRDCGRCLEAVPGDYEMEITMVFVPSDDLEDDDGETRLIAPSQYEIDLIPPLREEFLMSVPQVVVCRSDCRGLCPHCGLNLNIEVCGCGEQESDSRWDALRALKDE